MTSRGTAPSRIFNISTSPVVAVPVSLIIRTRFCSRPIFAHEKKIVRTPTTARPFDFGTAERRHFNVLSEIVLGLSARATDNRTNRTYYSVLSFTWFSGSYLKRDLKTNRM